MVHKSHLTHLDFPSDLSHTKNIAHQYILSYNKVVDISNLAIVRVAINDKFACSFKISKIYLQLQTTSGASECSLGRR